MIRRHLSSLIPACATVVHSAMMPSWGGSYTCFCDGSDWFWLVCLFIERRGQVSLPPPLLHMHTGQHWSTRTFWTSGKDATTVWLKRFLSEVKFDLRMMVNPYCPWDDWGGVVWPFWKEGKYWAWVGNRSSCWPEIPWGIGKFWRFQFCSGFVIF